MREHSREVCGGNWALPYERVSSGKRSIETSPETLLPEVHLNTVHSARATSWFVSPVKCIEVQREAKNRHYTLQTFTISTVHNLIAEPFPLQAFSVTDQRQSVIGVPSVVCG